MTATDAVTVRLDSKFKVRPGAGVTLAWTECDFRVLVEGPFVGDLDELAIHEIFNGACNQLPCSPTLEPGYRPDELELAPFATHRGVTLQVRVRNLSSVSRRVVLGLGGYVLDEERRRR